MTRIAAVILTHYPDLSVLPLALRAILPQVDGVLVVDNGTPWDEVPVLAGLDSADRAKIEFLWLKENTGVGAGHNRGIEWARGQGFSHVLILDHDSVPRFDMVEKLVAGLDALVQRRIPVAAVGPRWVDRYTGQVSGFVRVGNWKLQQVYCTAGRSGEVLETDFIISSGALIPMEVLDAIGGMNEDFFIDHVDTEWMFRARTRGYRSFGVCDAILEHSMGTATLRFWFGRWRNVPLHSPERHYYAFRNSILLMHLPCAPPRWRVNEFVRLCYMAVVYPLFAPDRLRRIRLIAKGIWHGLRGLNGQLRLS